MKCETCIQECKAEGGMCAPLDPDRVHWCEDWMYQAEADHKHDAHLMTLHGALWECDKGHDVEATPQDTMRAAGVPMLL